MVKGEEMNELGGESIVCFAGEDWWYHHPHSKNHILKRLAAQNRVLFVNSITMGLPAVRNPDFFLKVRRKFKSYMRWLRRVFPTMWVMTPIAVPLYTSRFWRSLNAAMLAFQIRLAMFFCGMKRPILWVAIPSAADAAARLDHKLLIYQVSDKYDANEDSALRPSVIRELDERLRRSAALVMYSGRKLYAEAEEADVPNRYFLEQAVDYEHFSRPAETHPEVAHIPRPILGYFGAMDYVMDTELIEEVARQRPQWHWLFLGLKSNLVQFRSSNLHWLGPKPYELLPQYISAFDVCVLPWRQQNAFTSYGSAIKVREYLATGRPVVISPLFEYLHTPGVRIYHSVAEFIEQVEEALAEQGDGYRKVRQDAVRNCTWDVRTRELAAKIAALLATRPGPSSAVEPAAKLSISNH